MFASLPELPQRRIGPPHNQPDRGFRLRLLLKPPRYFGRRAVQLCLRGVSEMLTWARGEARPKRDREGVS